MARLRLAALLLGLLLLSTAGSGLRSRPAMCGSPPQSRRPSVTPGPPTDPSAVARDLISRALPFRGDGIVGSETSEVLSRWIEEEGSSAPSLWTRVIREVSGVRDGWRIAGAVVGFMRARGGDLEPNEYHYSSLVSIYGKAGRLREAFDLVDRIRGESNGTRPGTPTYNALLSCCERAWKADVALRVLERMDASGVPKDAITYTTVIKTLGRADRATDAVRMIARMESEGLSPNAYTFNAAISACERAGLWRPCLRLLEDMRASGVRADLITYNSAISCMAKAGQGRKALGLLRDLRSAGLAPDLISYSVAIRAAERVGLWRECLRLLREMRSCGIAPPTIVYRSVVSVCAKHGQSEVAEQLLQEMSHGGIAPTVVSISAAISAASHAGDWRQALELLELLKELGMDPNVKTYGAAISACANAAEFERAVALLEEMQEDYRIRPNVIVYSAAISACARAATPEAAAAAKALLEDMAAKSVRPDLPCWTAAIAAAEGPEDALAVYERLLEEGFEADVVAMNTLLDKVLPVDLKRGAGAEDLEARAERLFDRAAANFLPPYRNAARDAATVNVGDLSAAAAGIALRRWIAGPVRRAAEDGALPGELRIVAGRAARRGAKAGTDRRARRVEDLELRLRGMALPTRRKADERGAQVYAVSREDMLAWMRSQEAGA